LPGTNTLAYYGNKFYDTDPRHPNTNYDPKKFVRKFGEYQLEFVELPQGNMIYLEC
jgi:hypothetical protein